MAWVTQITVPAQVVYRTKKGCLCDGIEPVEPGAEQAAGADAQVGYRLQSEVPEEPLRWIGKGLAAVGLTDGAEFAEGDEDRAMALMDWRDPRTGQRLMKPRVVADPRAKLPTVVLLQALDALAEARGVTTEDVLASNQKSLAALTRLRNVVRRDGDGHVSSIKLLEKVAATARLDLADLYPAGDLARADRYRDRHVVNALRGNDFVLDVTKSLSALYALGDPQLAQAVMDIVQEAGRDAIGALEDAVAYGMRGEHGGGHTARRVEADGLLGWVMTHVSARPVDGEVGDPHLHLHVSLAHMVRGSEDGQWSAPGAGGNDLMRHAKFVDRVFKARIRALTIDRLGARWELSERTDEWELVGVDQEMRDVLSRRHQQLADEFGGSLEGVSRDQQKATARLIAQAKTSVTTTSGDARADWRARFRAGGFDPDRMVDDVLGGGPDGGAGIGLGGGPQMPSPEEIAAHVFRADVGLDAHSKTFHHAELLSAIAHALPGGMLPGTVDVPDLEDLAAAVLALEGVVVRLPDQGAVHVTHPQRYTTGAVLEAERYLVEQAVERLSSGAAVLPDATVEAAIGVFEASRGYRISAEQRASVVRLLTAGHGVDELQGVAGSGKTTVMSVVRIALESSGLVVAGAATAAVAAANLEADSGIPARTVAAWVRRIEQGDGEGLTGVDVLVVEEAAMVDDRQLQKLIAEAGRTGTKIIGIGDPEQLRAVGVGGAFRRIHDLVGGLTLRENRRQRDAGDREALQTWRDGARRTALAAFAERGRVHATEFPEQALAGILGAWDQARTAWSDPHERTEQLLVLAARNADVEALNAGARAIRRAAGELGPDTVYRLAGGGSVRLAVGDAVRVRANDYRSKRGGNDVLNGQRAQVTAIGPGRAVTITWRRSTADGPVEVSETLTPKQLAEGIVSHGYALTIAAAQGLTAETALVYGVGADAYSLYPALTRARGESHLWLPSSLIEDADTRTRLGEPRSERERLDRAVAAYATRLERDRPDGMVMDEIDGPPRREPPTVPPQAGGERARRDRDQDGDYLLDPPLQLVPAGPLPDPEQGGDGGDGGAQRQRAAEQQAAARLAEQHQVQQQRAAQEQADALAAAALTATPETAELAEADPARPGDGDSDALAARDAQTLAPDDIERLVDQQREQMAADVEVPADVEAAPAVDQRAAAAARDEQDRARATRTPAPERRTEPQQAPQPAAAEAQAVELPAPEQQRLSHREAAEQRAQMRQARHDSAVPSWTVRPMGAVRSARLAPEIAQTQALATAARANAQQLQRQADEAAAALGTDAAPGQQRAQNLGSYLDEAAKHWDKARIASRSEDAAYKVAAAARATAASADTQAKRKPWMLLATGTSRSEQEAKAEAARKEARLAVTAAGEFHNTWDDERRAAHQDALKAAKAISHPGSMWVIALNDDIPEEIEKLRREIATRAIEGWAVQDRRAVERLSAEAAKQHAAADKLGQRVLGLRAEQELRATLSPEREQQDDKERASSDRANQQAKAARNQERQNQLTAQQQNRTYRPPQPPKHRGPSHGL